MLDIVLKIAGILGSVGVILSAITFYQNSRLRRATWITELHKKFFETDQYKHMRRVLDYQTEEYELLKSSFSTWSSDQVELQEKFVDYINFFEYIQTLVAMEQLTLAEVNSLFGYQIRQLADTDWIMHAFEQSKSLKLKRMVQDVAALKSN